MGWIAEHWTDFLSFFGGAGGMKLMDHLLNRKSKSLAEEAAAIKNLRDLLDEYRQENERLRGQVNSMEIRLLAVNRQNALMLGVLLKIAPDEASEILSATNPT